MHVSTHTYICTYKEMEKKMEEYITWREKIFPVKNDIFK